MLTRHHWAKDLLDAGHRPGRKRSQSNYNDHVFATKASHLDGGHRLWSGMERDGLRHATSAQDSHMMMTTITQPIPDRPSPGLERAAPSAAYQGGGESVRLIYRTTRSVPGATSLWAHGP